MALFRLAIVVACALVFGQAFADDCSRGQSEWCKDLKQAIKCSAVSHCMSNSWRNEIPMKDASEECIFCQAIVAEVMSFITNNKSIEFIEDFFMKACDFIPVTTASAECKIIVKEDLPYIIQMIKEKVDAEVICGLIGFCNNQFGSGRFSSSSDEDHHYFKTDQHHYGNGDSNNDDEKVDINICKECKDFVNVTKDALLSKSVEQKVIKLVNDFICPLFIFGREKCKTFTQKQLPAMFARLRKDFDPDKICAVFCKSRGFLAGSSLYKEKVLSAFKALKSSGAFCTECKGLFAILREEFYDPKLMSTAADFIATEACSFMKDAENSQMCTKNGKEALLNILDYVLFKMDPDVVCCGNVSSPSGQKSEGKAVVDLKDDKCQVCEMVAQYLEALLETVVVIEEIESLVSKICTFLPDTMQPTCNDIIKEYSPMIVHYIADYASPREICQHLNLCQSEFNTHIKCIKGPEFWCASPENAKLCMAEEHCKKFSWA